MADESSHVDLFREWVAALLSGADALLDDAKKEKLLESCGRTCAVHYGSVKSAQSIAKSTTEIDDLVKQVNEKISWCGKWGREKDTISSVCTSCGCPLVRDGLLSLSPILCNCSRGYVKAVFEVILGRPVIVDLEQAIGRGDEICRYVVKTR